MVRAGLLETLVVGPRGEPSSPRLDAARITGAFGPWDRSGARFSADYRILMTPLAFEDIHTHALLRATTGDKLQFGHRHASKTVLLGPS